MGIKTSYLPADMCDRDGGGKLSVDELRQMLTLVHGKGPQKKGAKIEQEIESFGVSA